MKMNHGGTENTEIIILARFAGIILSSLLSVMKIDVCRTRQK